MLANSSNISSKYNLDIAFDKTKRMGLIIDQDQAHITVCGSTLARVVTFNYLGSTVGVSGGATEVV